MRRRTATAAAVVTIAVAVVVSIDAAQDADTPAPAPAPTHAGPPCQVRHTAAGLLPDPDCTPGRTLPGVTAAEVCTPGWATDHRNVPASVRRQVLARYGVPTDRHFEGELDHLISLQLGGTNAAENLWPQAGKIPNEKDLIEGRLHRLVCSGRLELAEAQRRIAADWTAVSAG